ncbi:hypothetical protein BDW69DRAFT_75330 [Aspergillus filifer]
MYLVISHVIEVLTLNKYEGEKSGAVLQTEGTNRGFNYNLRSSSFKNTQPQGDRDQQPEKRPKTHNEWPDDRGSNQEPDKMQAQWFSTPLPHSKAAANSCCPGDNASSQLHGDELPIAPSAVSKEGKHIEQKHESLYPCFFQLTSCPSVGDFDCPLTFLSSWTFAE